MTHSNYPTPEKKKVRRARLRRIEGYVWCDEHGAVHEDTTDPYGYGEPDCRKVDHRAVYARTGE